MKNLKLTDSLGLPAPYHPLSQQNSQNHDNISGLKSSIISLHDDILWQIFLLNADMVNETEDKDAIAAINTLRYSSQVCSSWRHVILSFSSLWAQVINFSHLEHDEWREEVLRRTGRSLLSVFWGPPSQASLSEKLVAEILNQQWDRIRWLQLDFTNHHGFVDACSILQFWNVFRRPSKVLETFRVFFGRLEQKPIYTISPSDFIIFDNLAPALRVFCAPKIKFNLDAPWLANIRFLALNDQVSAYDLIRAIPHMPHLECLEDETSNAIGCTGDALSSLPHITAPSIKEIILSSYRDMGPYMDFLTQIKPAAGCYLTFSHTGRTPDATTLTLANEVLYTYSRCCDFPSDISLELYQYHFHFVAQIPHKGQFRFELRPYKELPHELRRYKELPRDIIGAFFTALPLVKFQDVKTLALSISPDLFEPADSRIAQFILSVPSVETLTIDPKTLRFFLNLHSDIFSLSFPLLQTVEISGYLQGGELLTIKEFLTSRISSGRPVDVLSLSIDLDALTDLRSLEDFTGLTIILQCDGQEYKKICGDGHIVDLLIS